MTYGRLPLRSKLTPIERGNLIRGFDTGNTYMDEICRFVGDQNFLIFGFEYRGVPYAGRIAASLSSEETADGDRFREGIVDTVYFLLDKDADGNITDYGLGSINKDMLSIRERFIFVDESFADYDDFGLPPNFVAARKMLRYSSGAEKKSGGAVCNIDNCAFVKCSPFQLMTAQEVYQWTFEGVAEDGSPMFKLTAKDLGSGSTNDIISRKGKEIENFVGELRSRKGDYLVCAPTDNVVDALGICLYLNEDHRQTFCEVSGDSLETVARKFPAGKKIVVVGSLKVQNQLIGQRSNLGISTDDIKLVS